MGFWSTTAIVLVTAILAWIGHAIVSELQRRAEKDRLLEQEKREAYKLLLGTLYDILASVKRKNTKERMPEIEGRLFQLVRDMTVYASDDVLRLFIKMKSQQEGADPKAVLLVFAEVILAVRRDLGHTNTTITQKELLSTFITDIEELGIK